MLKLITPKELKVAMPLPNQEAIIRTRKEIADIIKGVSERTLLVVGPCSIHDLDSAMEYARCLKELSCEVEDVFLLCMRTYFEKSRTSLGWKGLLYDPDIDGQNNLQKGLEASRQLLVYLNQLGLPAGTEFLEPLSLAYLEDGISWGSIGARTCQSPVHRQLASGLSMPVGMKNRCDGNVEIAIQACLTAQKPHTFIGISPDGYAATVKTSGNSLSHLVLRGAKNYTNYDSSSVKEASHLLRRAGLLNRIVVDCSHDNCEGDYRNQERVFFDVIKQLESPPNSICGLMVESFLLPGAQSDMLSKTRGASITDPCLDWETTKMMIRQGANSLRKKAAICA